MATVDQNYRSLLAEVAPRPITSQKEYTRALSYLEPRIGAKLSKAEGMIVDLMATLVADYEARHFPIPAVAPGERLAHLIEARGLTRAQVARETGIPRATITNVINGSRGISKENAVKLGRFFHVSPADFLLD